MYTNNRKSFWDGTNKAIFFTFEMLFWMFSISTSAHFLHTIFQNWTQTALGLMIFEGGLIGWRARFSTRTDPITKALSGIGMLAAGTASVFSTVADIVLIQSGAIISPEWSAYTLYAIGIVTAIHLILIFGLAIVQNHGKIATEATAYQEWDELPEGEWQTTPKPTHQPNKLPTQLPTQLPAAHTTHQPVAQPTQLQTPAAIPLAYTTQLQTQLPTQLPAAQPTQPKNGATPHPNQ